MITQPRFTAADGLRYGLLGLPLAFVALPLYVILPNHYAREFGVPLATLGAVLLGARLFDAVIDPWIGRLNDRLFARSAGAVLALGALAALLVAGGNVLLFFPQTREPSALLAWATAALVLTYAGYSALTIAHQSWGARLGGDESQRGRIVAWREGLGLAGVLLASLVSVAAGPAIASAVLFAALAAGWLAWARGRRPPPAQCETAGFDLWLPLAQPAFRRLLAVFLLNGIASALHGAGAQVTVSARNAHALQDFAGQHPGAITVAMDAADRDAVRRAAQDILARGPLDTVLYCAGYYREQRASEFDLDDMLRHQQVNYVGALHVLDAVLPHFGARGSGHISLVSSVAGYRGLPKSLAYGPTKAALINLAETLYLDLRDQRIGVSLICPGFVATRLTAQNRFEMPALITPEQSAQAILRGWSQGRFEIHFPRRFTLAMKLLRLLPFRLYRGVVRRTTGL